MNWQTATIDEINAYCAKCDPAWDEAVKKNKDASGGKGILWRPYLTLLDGHEELTEYGSRLIRLAMECEGYGDALLDNWRALYGNARDPRKRCLECAVFATPRQRLYAACDVLERNEQHDTNRTT